nr:uncharacterized protein LOC124811960 [Hydra vulgaris]
MDADTKKENLSNLETDKEKLLKIQIKLAKTIQEEATNLLINFRCDLESYYVITTERNPDNIMSRLSENTSALLQINKLLTKLKNNQIQIRVFKKRYQQQLRKASWAHERKKRVNYEKNMEIFDEIKNKMKKKTFCDNNDPMQEPFCIKQERISEDSIKQEELSDDDLNFK